MRYIQRCQLCAKSVHVLFVTLVIAGGNSLFSESLQSTATHACSDDNACIELAQGAIRRVASSHNVNLLPWEEGNGKRQLVALRRSYPAVISDVQYRDGEWAIKVQDIWFYWAQGRMLPEDARANYEQYASIRFYNYYRGPATLHEITAEQEERIRAFFPGDDTNARRSDRHNAFLDTLYDIRNQREADDRMVRMDFLGHRTTVHPFLQMPLQRVAQKIMRRAAIDDEVREFVNTMHSMSGYVWRNIRGTNARSYHGYGAAVDLLHTEYKSAHVYWRWSAEDVEEWWKIPLAQRWMPPQIIIDIFESEGFVWGGKWLLFDMLHFEYRPEVLLLSR